MSSRKNYGQRISFDREKKIDAVLILISLIFVLGFLYLDSDLTGYAVLRTTNDTFDDGDFNRTFWNKTGFVQLNYTQGFFKGNYTSSVIDAGSLVSWSNISWCEASGCLNMYGEELPANQKGLRTSSSVDRRINMTGNVLYFRFNNQSAFGETDARNVGNSVYDFSNNGNNATLGNASTGTDPTLVSESCLFGNCYSFNGRGNFINRSVSLLDPMEAFTFSAWVKINDSGANLIYAEGASPAGTNTFVSFSCRPTGLRIDSRNDATTEVGALTTNAGCAIGRLHHFAVINDGSENYNFYLDGVQYSETSDTMSGTYNNLDQFNIGILQRQQNYDNPFNGTIDEVAVWNRSLSANEIKQIYLAGATNLSLQVRSCNDSSCSGENFVGPDNTANTYFTNASLVELNTTITPNNRWFQFRHLFEANGTGSTTNTTVNSTAPELYNITINNNASSNLENINGLVPANNAKFNLSDVIEISVNITDDQAPYPQTVLANITQPNGTIRQLTLTNSTYNNKFNKTFTTELAGRYILRIIANDTDNNVNNTEVTAWDVDSNLTFLNRSNSITAWGYLNGIFNNTYFNSSNYSVQLNTSAGKFRGNYTSQIFTIGSSIALSNLSWCESA